MKSNLHNILLSFLSLLIITSTSCFVTHDETELVIEGFKPIYANDLEWQNINVQGPRPLGKLGKIYYKDQMIYVNEINQGIHIIDNTNPVNPVPIQFIAVLGSKDIAIKQNYLYADNVSDLVVLDISDVYNINTVNRIPNVYPLIDQNFPEFERGYFECVDASLGTVIYWESAVLNDPKCRNF